MKYLASLMMGFSFAFMMFWCFKLYRGIGEENIIDDGFRLLLIAINFWSMIINFETWQREVKKCD